jgi:hypothetical protein
MLRDVESIRLQVGKRLFPYRRDETDREARGEEGMTPLLAGLLAASVDDLVMAKQEQVEPSIYLFRVFNLRAWRTRITWSHLKITELVPRGSGGAKLGTVGKESRSTLTLKLKMVKEGLDWPPRHASCQGSKCSPTTHLTGRSYCGVSHGVDKIS